MTTVQKITLPLFKAICNFLFSTSLHRKTVISAIHEQGTVPPTSLLREALTLLQVLCANDSKPGERAVGILQRGAPEPYRKVSTAWF